MLRGRNQDKRSFIPQHSKDNVAELVDDSTQGGHFCLSFTLFQIIHAKNWLLRQVRGGGVPGLSNYGVKTKVGIELFWTAESAEIVYFTDDSNSGQEPGSGDRFQKLRLPGEQRIRALPAAGTERH